MQKREKSKMGRFLRDSAKGISIAFALILILEVILRLAAFALVSQRILPFLRLSQLGRKSGDNPLVDVRR